MDILAITETSEKEDNFFFQNIEIEGYENYHTASKSSRTMYVNSSFDALERCDLNISNIEFETKLIEIKNKIVKIKCGSIYRHPHNNFEDFF